MNQPSPGPAGAHPTRTGLGVLLTLAAMLAFALMDGISKVLAGALAISQILWVRYILFLLLAFLVLRTEGIGTIARSDAMCIGYEAIAASFPPSITNE